MRIGKSARPGLSALLLTLLALTGCGGGGDGSDAVTAPAVAATPAADPQPADPDAGPQPTDPDTGPRPAGPAPAFKHLFTPVDDATWDETAVRKVLHTFAYGGQTTDTQIRKWADMAPEHAIAQILTFEQHNLLLSTPSPDDTDDLANRDGTLRGLAAFWASDDPANGIPAEFRHRYRLSHTGGSLRETWQRAAISRGLNPFRAKVGLWETNYHMAVSQSGVARMPLLRYYEDIMQAHERGLPYHRVMAVAAKSAAVAMQYGHRTNRFTAGRCACNEDFAREYHQLFFGILGAANPLYHETVTIKNTAKAFTDMAVHSDELTGPAETVDFGSFFHPDEPLEILGHMIGGTNASQRIEQMVEVSIVHPESLANLPVKIVADLADDNLDERKTAEIRAAWRKMEEKNLLQFLRGYAISTIFHDASRIKLLTSIDRNLLFANLTSAGNREHYLNLYRPQHYHEGVVEFAPIHGVFGGQTGDEAASSDLVLRNAVNLSTQHVWRTRLTEGERFGINWERDYSRVVPRNSTANYRIEDIAAWLWERYIADGLKNYGALERAHTIALLGADRDLGMLVDPAAPDRALSVDEVLDPSVSLVIDSLASKTMPLDSADDTARQIANRKLGLAINFVTGTPFMFAQEGR